MDRLPDSIRSAPGSNSPPEKVAFVSPDSFGTALLRARARRPDTSDLGTCLVAMFASP